MKNYRIMRSYKAQYTDPIILQKGEFVKLCEEETQEKWKGWIRAENKTHKGWIPKQIIQFSDDKKTGIILEFYTAKELDVEAGDYIQKVRSLNGWTWSINLRTNNEGWIPDEVFEDSLKIIS